MVVFEVMQELAKMPAGAEVREDGGKIIWEVMYDKDTKNVYLHHDD